MLVAAAAALCVVNDRLPADIAPTVPIVTTCKEDIVHLGSGDLQLVWDQCIKPQRGDRATPDELHVQFMQLGKQLQNRGYEDPAEPAAAAAPAAAAPVAQPGTAARERRTRSTTAVEKKPAAASSKASQGPAAGGKRGRSGSSSGRNKKAKAPKLAGQQDAADAEQELRGQVSLPAQTTPDDEQQAAQAEEPQEPGWQLQQQQEQLEAQAEQLQEASRQLEAYMTENQGLQDQVAAAAEEVQAVRAAHAEEVRELQAASAKQKHEIEMLRQQLSERQAADKQLWQPHWRLACITTFRRSAFRELASTEQQLADAREQITSLEAARAEAAAAANRQLEEQLHADEQRLLRDLCRELPHACRAVQRYKADSNWNKAADGSVLVTERDKRKYTKQLARIIILLEEVDLMDSKGQLTEDGEELAQLGEDKPLTNPEALKCLEGWAWLFRRAQVSDLAEASNRAKAAATDASAGASA